MRIIPASDIADALTCKDLTEILRAAFRTGAVPPASGHHRVALPDQPDASLFLSPICTEFKSAGTALADLAAAVHVFSRV